MSEYKCNSCGATYSDVTQNGGAYYHACSPEVIEPATFDDTGKQLSAEKRTPRENPRDERLLDGLVFDEGVVKVPVPDPETPGRMILKPAASLIVSEGAGRTLVAP